MDRAGVYTSARMQRFDQGDAAASSRFTQAVFPKPFFPSRFIQAVSMTSRLGYLAGFLVCAGLVAFALYLQHYQGQDPCPLCIVQRVAYIALGAIFLVAAVHGPARTAATVYGGLLVLVAALGSAVAARHVWLQHLPKDRIPECGPGLEYMLRKYSPPQALGKLLAGSGECAESGWSLLGLSIAEWSLLWLILLGAFAVYVTIRARRSSKASTS